MSNRPPEIPEEAVEDARIAFEKSRLKPTELAIADALQAAAPAIRKQERERLLKELRSLAPHELSCNSCRGWSFAELDRHSDECPRGQLGHVLATLEDTEEGRG